MVSSTPWPHFTPGKDPVPILSYCHMAGNTECPTTYQTRQFFNNSKTNEDIATRFEQEYVRCVRNEKECVCSKIMSVCVCSKIIKDLPGLVSSGTPCISSLYFPILVWSTTTLNTFSLLFLNKLWDGTLEQGKKTSFHKVLFHHSTSHKV